MARCPFAVWVPGPPEKRLGTITPRAITGHSAVGFKAGLRDVLHSSIIPWAWHFSIYYDGLIEQHYDTTALVLHGHDSNGFADGVEHEGGFNPEDEPLRPDQLAASIRLMRWIGAEHNFALRRAQPGRTLLEHNEFANKPCPSARIPWELYEEGSEVVTMPIQDPTRPLTAIESLELQYVMGKGAIALPNPVTLTETELKLFVEGQVGQTIPAGTEVYEYRVLVPVNPPGQWVGKER